MPVLTVESPHIIPDTDAHSPVTSLAPGSLVEDELGAMVETLKAMGSDAPDLVISTCMSLMARCTEILLMLNKVESTSRRAKSVRITQLQPVMELIEFQAKYASRLIEVRRQEMELMK